MTRSSEHNGALLKAVFVLYLISYSIVKSRGLFYLIDDLGFHIDMINSGQESCRCKDLDKFLTKHTCFLKLLKKC